MRKLFYRLYLQLIKLSVGLRQRAFAAYLSGRKSQLVEADLSYLYLAGIDLRGANLYRAKLIRADLHGARLNGANLQEADLRYADLRGADLREANLLEADLHGANLQGAQIDALQLGLAGSLERTILPTGARYQDQYADRQR
ncbi:MAG: pentapeptide repeat-containing protein [Anaerolineae bacterium]|nr:pentapeptide repeat-containing protein [Anaerolineae bacterium]